MSSGIASPEVVLGERLDDLSTGKHPELGLSECLGDLSSGIASPEVVLGERLDDLSTGIAS